MRTASHAGSTYELPGIPRLQLPQSSAKVASPSTAALPIPSDSGVGKVL